MNFMLDKFKSKNEQFKVVNLIGKKGYRVLLDKSQLRNVSQKELAWQEIKH